MRGHYATRWGPRQHRWERKAASLRTSFSHHASQQPTALGRIARQEPVPEAVMIPLPVRGLSSLVGYAMPLFDFAQGRPCAGERKSEGKD